MLIHLKSSVEGKLNLDQMIETLSAGGVTVHLKRFDEEGGEIEASFALELQSYQQLSSLRESLIAKDSNLSSVLSITSTLANARSKRAQCSERKPFKLFFLGIFCL